MFRCSDHDPVLVGLRLGAAIQPRIPDASAADMTITVRDGLPVIHYAAGGYYTVYTLSGCPVVQGNISGPEFTLPEPLASGCYVVSVYVENTVLHKKVYIL